MISKLTKEEVQEVIQLGTMLNPNFSKLFHIENLNPNETIYIYKENNINKGFIHIQNGLDIIATVSYTHLRANETRHAIVSRLQIE